MSTRREKTFPRMPRPGCFWRCCLTVVVALAVGACSKGGSGGKQPRLVLLYAPCTVNKNFLAPYNSAVDYTPNLNNFQSKSLVFERHHTESGQSGIAFASLFSGTQATSHKVFSHPSKLSDDVTLVTEAYAAAGYDVHSWLAHGMANRALNYAQGVDLKNTSRGPLVAGHPKLARILDRLRTEPDYRAFIVTNFTVTHGPYKTDWLDGFCSAYPDQCSIRDHPEFHRSVKIYRSNMRRLGWDFANTVEKLRLSDDRLGILAQSVELVYKSTVFHLDQMFGRLVDAVDKAGILDSTVIAFTNDHGEILYRPNAYMHWTHGYQLAPEVIHIAWLLYGPGAGVMPGRYEKPTRSIDVFPTLAGLSGIETPAFDDFGRDLSRAVRGLEEAPDLLAFSHTSIHQPKVWEKFKKYSTFASLFPEQIPESMWVSVRDADLFAKLRRIDGRHWTKAVYDLGSDPGEAENIYDDANEAHRRLFEELEDYKLRLVDSARASEEGEISLSRSIELLRSLGYVD